MKSNIFATNSRRLSAFGFAVCLVVAGFFASCGPSSDSFGKDHPIPDGMAYEIPLQEDTPAPSADIMNVESYLQLRNGVQGGVYLYSFSYPALSDGEVYLRCYEATEGIELSASRLKEASTVEVKNHTDFGPIAEEQQFTIYEGDWDDYYAARIEVWHKDAKTGVATKLMDKTYRVEGWMR